MIQLGKMPNSAAQFTIVSPGHASIYDAEALALHKRGALHFIAMGTRRGVTGLPAEVTRLKPVIGLGTYITARTMSAYAAESFRFRLYPWFDRWAKKQLRPGNHIISSYAYANESFQWTHEQGGKKRFSTAAIRNLTIFGKFSSKSTSAGIAPIRRSRGITTTGHGR